jgi:hypothetical protein
MALNYPNMVYMPAFVAFARPATFEPRESQPGQPSYTRRGIFDTRTLDVVAEDGSIVSDQETILDILEVEFSVLPLAGDRVTIPANAGMPGVGQFEIIDASTNGGGETTLTLRKIITLPS